MKTQEFLTLLQENEHKALLFEYKEGQFVDTNYHITEVKNAVIKSVDCGGRSDVWNETIIQLWESPSEKGKLGYMKSKKALEILERVSAIHPFDGEAITKFEYSNENFHKADLEIQDVQFEANKMIVKLFVSATDCKAKELCGVPEKLEVLATESSACCDPKSGCC
tara:strand:- start:12613 stop:13110 length:498 start_codon:yes stop_codon:yes gene_type:complete